jgi:hypothetical protein
LNQFRGRPKRFVLPLVIENEKENQIDLSYTTGQAKLIGKNQLWIEPEILVDAGCELPQLDYVNYYGKFYQFFYAINSDIDYKYCGAVRMNNEI